MAYSPNSLIDQRRWRPFPVTSAVAAAGPPPPGHPLPHFHMSTARSAWWRGSQRHGLSLGALSLTAERHSSSSSTDASDAADGSPSGNDSGTSAGSSSSQHPLLASPAYQAALRASLSRTSLTAEQLLQAAAAQSSASPKARMLDSYSDMQRLLAAAMAALAGPALTEMLEGWAAAAYERPSGFDSQAVLALPGLAEAAVVSRGGRMSNRWKSENQDAFLLQLLGNTAGAAGAAGAADAADAAGTAAQQRPSLLVGVLDGHGVGGQAASRLAAEGIAAELTQRLGSGGSSGSGDGSGSGSGTPASQQALVQAFQHVAARMQADAAFHEGGTAAVVCLVEHGSITCAWAGDCRAVASLSLNAPDGPTFVVHPLTQDHKPDSPQELARVVASGLGRVVQFSAGAPPRLCGVGNPNTLALSRALGDNWALPMGLTAEPDAVTVALPPPAPSTPGPRTAAVPGGIDSLSTDKEEQDASGSSGDGSSSSSSSRDSGCGGSSSSISSIGSAEAAPARHVLLVACDGLWDYVTNQEAVDIALRHGSAEAAAHALADTARRRWAAAFNGEYVDDITVAVCFIH